MTWKECDLRAYLNGEFFEDTFTEEERARIRLGNVNTPYCNGNPGGGITKDSVFLLSADEAAAYFPDDASRAACLRSGEPCWWWLRSPGTYKDYVSDVFIPGNILGNHAVIGKGGVRPAMWLYF